MIEAIDLRAGAPEVAAALDRVYSTIGFGLVVGHEVDPGLIDAILAQTARFHALAREHKLDLRLDENHRGFIDSGTAVDRLSQYADVSTANHSASFMVMREEAVHDQTRYLSGPNQWPDLPGFREVVEEYQVAMSDLGGRLIDRFGDAIGAELASMFDPPTTWLRLLEYPPTPGGENNFGSAPHRDFGAITLVAQDDVGGLEVLDRAGHWIAVPRVDDAFVLNVGDVMHRWSNAKLRATPHRVVNRSSQLRHSVAYFHDPHIHTIVQPVGRHHEDTEFDPIRFDQLVRHELTSTYEQHDERHGNLST